jgi:hypothetical protein
MVTSNNGELYTRTTIGGITTETKAVFSEPTPIFLSLSSDPVNGQLVLGMGTSRSNSDRT